MLEEYKKIRNAYDRFADDYAENCSGILLSQIKSFIKELPEPAYVLDIGCGVGQDTLYLARQGVETIGIDFSEKMLEIANKESRTVKKAGFIKLEVSKISSYLKEVKFDGFWCSSLITHLTLKDIKKLLKDIKKISDNNSIFGITVKERKDKNVPITSDRKIIFNHFTSEEMTDILTKAGYTITKISKIGANKMRWLYFQGKIN